MPHFTSPIVAEGPILNVIFTVSEARRRALEKADRPVPSLVQVRGLVDTGASHTCVDPSIIQALEIPDSGFASMVTPTTGSSSVRKSTYDVGLAIFATNQDPPYHIRNMAVAECELSNQGFHALIGRDVLSKCILHYNGAAGVYTLAF